MIITSLAGGLSYMIIIENLTLELSWIWAWVLELGPNQWSSERQNAALVSFQMVWMIDEVSPVIILYSGWYSGTVGTDEDNRTSGYRISCSATSRLSKQTLGTILYHNWLQFGYHSLRSWELFPVSVLGLDWGIDGPGALIYSSSDHEELRNVIICWFSCKYGYGFQKLADFMQNIGFYG